MFLTTHYMDEAEYLADRITVLCAGRIVAEGTPGMLGGRDHMTTAISFTLPDQVHARDLPPGLSPLTEPGPGGSTVLHSQSPLVHLQMLGSSALGRGYDLPDLDVHRPTAAGSGLRYRVNRKVFTSASEIIASAKTTCITPRLSQFWGVRTPADRTGLVT